MGHAKTKAREKGVAVESQKIIDLPAGGREIESPLIIPDIEEKIADEDSPVLGVEEEEPDEAPSLDEEDLNPFGDKWEK